MATFDGHAIGWDFTEHKMNHAPGGSPYLGGTDLQHLRGARVKAYVTGKVTRRTTNAITITNPAGIRTVILHLTRIQVRAGDQVYTDTVVGYAGDLWPHWNDLAPDGSHVRSAIFAAIPDPLAPAPPTTPIRSSTGMEIRVIRVGGTDAAPKVKFMAFGPSGIDVEMTAEEWGATSKALGAAAPTGAMHLTQKQYDLELALVRKTAAPAGGAAAWPELTFTGTAKPTK